MCAVLCERNGLRKSLAGFFGWRVIEMGAPKKIMNFQKSHTYTEFYCIPLGNIKLVVDRKYIFI
jgi:hypothetical protein